MISALHSLRYSYTSIWNFFHATPRRRHMKIDATTSPCKPAAAVAGSVSAYMASRAACTMRLPKKLRHSRCIINAQMVCQLTRSMIRSRATKAHHAIQPRAIVRIKPSSHAKANLRLPWNFRYSRAR